MMLEVALIPLVLLVKVLAALLKVFELTALEVATTPLTVLLKVLPLMTSVLVVLLAMALASDVVAVTPLTVDESTVPEVESTFEEMMLVELATPFTLVVIVLALDETPFDEITDEVAVRPLIVVVRVLPASD